MEKTSENTAEKKHRTLGNRVFDLLVYPSIAFGSVFAFSIWSLHTTRYSKGWWHDAFIKTNKWLANQLELAPYFKNMSPEKRANEASNYAYILVSFAAGTILISPIKWLEDRREKIARHFDKLFGTTPRDDAHYAREPHQTWQSVYGGRLITLASVLTLGTAIGGKRTSMITQKAVDGVSSLWKKLRPNDSEATLTKVRQWTDVSAFEAFYTALCAAMVYATSRTLAKIFNKPHHAASDNASLPYIAATTDATDTDERKTAWAQREKAPDKTVSLAENVARRKQPGEQENPALMV